ncbi:hypothetical protein GP486_007023, partial [Trichoglossum hirsutum]
MTPDAPPGCAIGRQYSDVYTTTRTIHLACAVLVGHFVSLLKVPSPRYVRKIGIPGLVWHIGIFLLAPLTQLISLLSVLFSALWQYSAGKQRGGFSYRLAAALGVRATVPSSDETIPLLDLPCEDVGLQKGEISLGGIDSVTVVLALLALAAAHTFFWIRRLEHEGVNGNILDVRNGLVAVGGFSAGLWSILIIMAGSTWSVLPSRIQSVQNRESRRRNHRERREQRIASLAVIIHGVLLVTEISAVSLSDTAAYRYRETYFDSVYKIKEEAQRLEASEQTFNYTRAIEELHSRKISWDMSLPRHSEPYRSRLFIAWYDELSRANERFISDQRRANLVERELIDKFGLVLDMSVIPELYGASLRSLAHRYHQAYCNIIHQIKETIRESEASGQHFNYTHAVEQIYSRRVSWEGLPLPETSRWFAMWCNELFSNSETLISFQRAQARRGPILLKAYDEAFSASDEFKWINYSKYVEAASLLCLWLRLGFATASGFFELALITALTTYEEYLWS